MTESCLAEGELNSCLTINYPERNALHNVGVGVRGMYVFGLVHVKGFPQKIRRLCPALFDLDRPAHGAEFFRMRTSGSYR